jgi:PAS domain S-box-containing protein
MDDSNQQSTVQDRALPPGKVSCRNLGWCVDICREQKLDLNSLLRNLPFKKEHLEDPGNFIDWHSFRTLSDRFLHHFAEHEIRTAGRHSWQHNTMAVYKLMGSLNHSLIAHYTLGFGPQGFIAKLFPCELAIKKITDKHLEISLVMKDNLPPCRSFHMFLSGQMAGLTEVYDYEPAEVDIYQTNQGAKFNVTYSHVSPTLHKAKKIIRSLSTVNMSAHELRNLNDALIEKCRQLQNQSDNAHRVNVIKQQLEQKYQLIVNHLSEVVWTADFDLNLDFVSPSILSLSGYSDTQAKKISLKGLLSPQSYTDMKALVSTIVADQRRLTLPVTFQEQIRHKNGSTLWIDGELNLFLGDDLKPQFIVGVVRATPRRVARAQSDNVFSTTATLKIDRRSATQHTNKASINKTSDQFKKTQKLETLGQLVGGISHDFNNMLSGILSYSDIALDSTELPDSTKRYLREIESTSQKALRLTSQLMAFLGDKEIKFETVDITVVVEEMQSLIQISLSSSITIRFNYTQAMTLIHADRVQIEQMILNLAINARDAMSDGGILTISLYVRETASRGTDNLLVRRTTAQRVYLCVEDTGSGMTTEIQENMFTPYYTTKPKGLGTGLGMYQVLETVKSHQASINIESQLRVGTKIEIDFPSSE